MIIVCKLFKAIGITFICLRMFAQTVLPPLRASLNNGDGWSVPGASVILRAQPLVEAIMAALGFRRPLALNVGEDGDGSLVGQHAVIDRHGVGIGLAKQTLDPVFGYRD